MNDHLPQFTDVAPDIDGQHVDGKFTHSDCEDLETEEEDDVSHQHISESNQQQPLNRNTRVIQPPSWMKDCVSCVHNEEL